MSREPDQLGHRTRTVVERTFVAGVLVGVTAVVAPLVALTRKIIEDAKGKL